MELKPGYKTTEFWVTLFTTLVMGVLSVLVVYGIITVEQKTIWGDLIMGILAFVIPVMTIQLNKDYNLNRTGLKHVALQPGASSHRPEASE